MCKFVPFLEGLAVPSHPSVRPPARRRRRDGGDSGGAGRDRGSDRGGGGCRGRSHRRRGGGRGGVGSGRSGRGRGRDVDGCRGCGVGSDDDGGGNSDRQSLRQRRRLGRPQWRRMRRRRWHGGDGRDAGGAAGGSNESGCGTSDGGDGDNGGDGGDGGDSGTGGGCGGGSGRDRGRNIRGEAREQFRVMLRTLDFFQDAQGPRGLATGVGAKPWLPQPRTRAPLLLFLTPGWGGVSPHSSGQEQLTRARHTDFNNSEKTIFSLIRLKSISLNF